MNKNKSKKDLSLVIKIIRKKNFNLNIIKTFFYNYLKYLII